MSYYDSVLQVLPVRISQDLQMLLLQNMSSHALTMMSNGNLRESIHHVLDALSVLNSLKDVTIISDDWLAKVRPHSLIHSFRPFL